MINNRSRVFLCRAGVLAGLASLVWIAAAPEVAGQSGTAPQYAPNGDLLVPVGFERWLFVGSNLGLGYKTEGPAKTEFHNVYLSPGAYQVFRTTGQFRDGTILVMQKFAAADREPKGVLASGVYNGERTGLEVAVKNSHRPVQPSAPPPTPWAYYDFTDKRDPSKVAGTAEAFPDAVCEHCHKQHNASTDNVWVPFYPILRR